MSYPETPASSEKATRPLGFGLIVVFGLETLSNHLSQFLKTCAAPVLIIGIGTALPAFMGTDTKSGGTILLALISALLAIVGAILSMSFNVSWRRYLILGENPSAVYFGAGFWSWLGRSLLVGLGVGAITGLIGGIVTALFASKLIPTSIDAGNPATMIRQLAPIYGVFMLSSLPACWWVIRHLPYFTAQTVGDYDLRWKECSPLMRGLVLPYFFGVMVGVLPVIIPQVLASLAAQGHFGTFPPVLTVILSVIAQFFSFAYIAVYSSVAALFYVRLVGKRSPVAP